MAETKGFTAKSAREIAETVRAVRAMPKPIRRGKTNPPRLARLLPCVGRTDASHAKAASGTVSVYSGTPGSETDTGVNITAWNRWGDLDANTYVWCDHNGFGWYIIQADVTCP